MRRVALIIALGLSACAPKPVVKGSDRPITTQRPAFGTFQKTNPTAKDPSGSLAARIAKLRNQTRELRTTQTVEPELHDRISAGIDHPNE